MDECDFCLKEAMVHPVQFYGAELQICDACMAMGKYNILQLCPRCKMIEWINTDIPNGGLISVRLLCVQCTLGGVK